MRTTNTMNRSMKSERRRALLRGCLQGLLVVSILPAGVIIGWALLNVNLGIVFCQELRKFLKT